MFILCEKLEDDICVPILNQRGNIIEFDNLTDASDERIYLQVDYDNPIVVRGV